VDERNPMILLPSLGRRGPSDFIIERVFVLQDQIIPKALRRILEEVPLSQNDLALALDIPITTLWRILKGSSKDESLLRLIHLYLENTDLWRVLLQFTRGKITQKKYGLLNQYLKQIRTEKIGA
jgi:transcriptional regulator with XRE-family HTH domain